jgi:hypothetical protein
MLVSERVERASWGDVNGDGFGDLFIAEKDTTGRLFMNAEGGRLTEGREKLDRGNSSDSSHAGAWGDFDNDGDLDLHISARQNPNRLLRNDGGTTFTDVTVPPLGDRGDSYDAIWGDYDNDGDLDLFVGNNDETSLLLRNDKTTEGPVFTDVTAGPLRKAGAATTMTWVDIDNDGDLDLCVSDWDDAVQLFRNDLENKNHWLSVRLVGTRSNTCGIGARVRAVAGGRSQLRYVTGGSNSGAKTLRVHFGLGTSTSVDLLEIRWPSGTIQKLLDVPVDQHLVVQEGAQ